MLVQSGAPEQKTIIFCAGDSHADKVAIEMNNLYASWCQQNEQKPLQPYAFKCTSASSGNDQLPDLRGASRSHFIAATVDLLSTGVDVPVVQNIVFFKYVRSPIPFYQMVGRGTRLHPPSGKLMFRVYDYTNARRLFGQEFLTRFIKESGEGEVTPEPRPFTPPVQVQGFDVTITDAGKSILTMLDGKAMPVTVEEYKETLAQRLVAQAPTLDLFRQVWIDPAARLALLTALPDGARSALLVRVLDNLDSCDLYDVLAHLGYGLAPRTRPSAPEPLLQARGLAQGMPQERRDLARPGDAVWPLRHRRTGKPANFEIPDVSGRVGWPPCAHWATRWMCCERPRRAFLQCDCAKIHTRMVIMTDLNPLYDEIIGLISQAARFRKLVLHLHFPESYDFGDISGSDPTLNNRSQYLADGGEKLFLSHIGNSVDMICITDHMHSGYACRISNWVIDNQHHVKVLPGIELNIRLQAPLNSLKIM